MSGHPHIDYWSLLMHRNIADRIEAGDPLPLRIAAENLDRWRRLHGELSPPLAEWVAILDWPLPRLLELLRDATGQEATRRRSNSPFAGVIDNQLRLELLREARAA
ncbi:MAG: hypothetical protein ABI451_02780 [Dokdonella sp.]